MNDILKRFYDTGFSLFPVGQGKRPLIPWEGYKHKRADWVTIQGWGNMYHACNWAVVCGAVSGGLTILDCDDPKIVDLLRIDTLTVQTPSGGRHLYVRSNKIPEKEQAHKGYALDVQGERSYALIPPSTSDQGVYTIVKDVPIKEYEDIISYIDGKLVAISENRGREIDRFKQDVGTGLIESWVSKKGVGHNYWMGICPFHADSDPSFTVYDNGYYCFGCGEHGDVIDFVMKNERLDFKSALKRLSELSGVPVPIHVSEKNMSSDTIVAATIPEKTLDELEGLRKNRTTNSLRLTMNLPQGHFISKFTKWVASTTDAYPDYSIACGLSLLSAATKGRVTLHLKQEKLKTNIWVFLIGDSTVSRKSTVVNKTQSIMNASFIINECPESYSYEGYIEYLSEHPIAVCARDEAGGLLCEYKKKYMQGVIDAECRLYDGKSFARILTRGKNKEQREYKINDPYVLKLFATTPDSLARYTEIEDLTSGWLLRFLFVNPDYTKEFLPLQLETRDDVEAWGEVVIHLKRLHQTLETMGEVNFTIEPDALKFIQEAQRYMEESAQAKGNAIYSATIGRAVPYIFKIAILLELGKQEPSYTITLDTMKEAFTAVNDYFIPTMVGIAERLEEDIRNNNISKILFYLKKNGGLITHSYLLRYTKLVSRIFNECIDTMLESGVVERFKETGTKVIWYRLVEGTNTNANQNQNSPIHKIHPVHPFTDRDNRCVNDVNSDKKNNTDNPDNITTHAQVGELVVSEWVNDVNLVNRVNSIMEFCGICGSPIINNAETVGLGLGKIHPECKNNPVRIKLLKDIPAFIGVDNKKYGAYACGDIATVPAMNAYAIINRHFAEPIPIEPHIRRHRTDALIS
jgi:hypothetical protein